MTCMDYISLALKSPEIDGEKTMTLTVRDQRYGTVYVIRYGKMYVIQRSGSCRVYDEDEIEGVLSIELRRVLSVGKTRYVTDGKGPADASSIKCHFEKFDADTEGVRIARLSFQTRRGLTADTLVVTYDGHKIAVEHRSQIAVTRDDHPMISKTEFHDLDTALRCIEGHLALCDEHATVELGHETKLVEIKMLNTC